MYIRFALILLVGILLPSNVEAQASLAAEDIIDDVSIMIGNEREVFTLVREAKNPEQWYYIPNKPRLQKQSNGEPVLSLLRYQFRNPSKQEELVEQGLLQFSVAMAAPPEAIDLLKKEIRNRKGRDNVRLSAIPFKSAEVALYSGEGKDGKSHLISSAPSGVGLAPLFASQSMAFSVPLTRMGTDVMEPLIKGTTGLPVAVTFSFNALTPPAGFSVVIDLQKVYKHYSQDEKLRVSAAYLGWFNVGAEKSRQIIREELIKSGALQISAITSDNFQPENLDKYLSPILSKINEEVFETTKPPAEINPASAASIGDGKWYRFNGNYSVALKDVSKISKDTRTIDFKIQQIIERKTVSSGYIGIGEFPDTVKSKLVTLISGSAFKSAYLALPVPSLAQELDIKNIILETTLANGSEDIQRQVVTWKPGKNWQDISGTERTVLAFGLGGIVGSLKNARFVTKVRIVTTQQEYNIESTSSAQDGQAALSSITEDLFDVVEVSADGLSFVDLTPNGDILRVNIKLRVGAKEYRYTLRPRNVNNQKLPPNPFRLLIESSRNHPQDVTAEISCQTKNGLKEWSFNGLSFMDKFKGTSVTLSDVDMIIQPK